MKKQRRGLILYSSVTGNTEMVARAFAETMEKNGWEATLRKIDTTTNFRENPVYLDQYDVICLGSPVMAGLPSPQLARTLGMTSPELAPMFSDGEPGMIKHRDNIKCVVFATYAGGIREAYSTLAVEKQYLECKGLDVVGEFSCPGREIRHMSVDATANILGVQVENAAELFALYRADPQNVRFSRLTAGQRAKMEQALADDRDNPAYDDFVAHFVPPKYDLDSRPNQRDLTKAGIFIEEIIQDYFEGRETPMRFEGSMYLCIG